MVARTSRMLSVWASVQLSRMVSDFQNNSTIHHMEGLLQFTNRPNCAADMARQTQSDLAATNTKLCNCGCVWKYLG
jgi:hypothetical protein